MALGTMYELAEAINSIVCAVAKIDDMDIHITYIVDGEQQPLVITYIGGIHYKVLYGHEDFSWIEESDIVLKKIAEKCDNSGLDRFTTDEYREWGERWGWD